MNTWVTIIVLLILLPPIVFLLKDYFLYLFALWSAGAPIPVFKKNTFTISRICNKLYIFGNFKRTTLETISTVLCNHVFKIQSIWGWFIIIFIWFSHVFTLLKFPYACKSSSFLFYVIINLYPKLWWMWEIFSYLL